MAQQTKTGSLVEVAVTTGIGFAVSILLGQFVLYPMFNIEVNLAENIGLTSGFVGVSMLLKYAFRRTFDRLNIFTVEGDDK